MIASTKSLDETRTAVEELNSYISNLKVDAEDLASKLLLASGIHISKETEQRLKKLAVIIILSNMKYISDRAKAQTDALSAAFDAETVKLKSTLDDTKKEVDSLIDSIKKASKLLKKLSAHSSISDTVLVFWITVLLVLGIFYTATVVGFLCGMTISDLGWMLWIVPGLIALIIGIFAAVQYFSDTHGR